MKRPRNGNSSAADAAARPRGAASDMASLVQRLEDQSRHIAAMEAQLAQLRVDSARADTVRSYPSDTEIFVRCARSGA